MSNDVNKVTFVLTGPREGFTGVLGKRYGFRDGKLTVDHIFRDPFRIILCTNYCCNIKGEAPLWKTVDGASVKITDVEKPRVETTTVKSAPVHTTEGPSTSSRSESEDVAAASKSSSDSSNKG
jgi:hypothetical protein